MIFEEVKKISLESFLTDNGIKIHNGMLCCIGHKDVNPSAKIYDDNKVWCFSCQKSYDIVDFYKHIHHVDTQTALLKLKREYGLSDTFKPTPRPKTAEQRKKDFVNSIILQYDSISRNLSCSDCFGIVLILYNRLFVMTPSYLDYVTLELLLAHIQGREGQQAIY